MTAGNWFLLFSSAVAMATSLPFNKVLVADITPLALAALRAAIGAPILFLILLVARLGLPLARRDLATGAIGAMCHVAIPFGAIAWGQQYIASGLGGTLYATTPLCAAMFAHVLTRDEKLSVVKLVGIALGMGGVGFLIGNAALGAAGNHLLGVIVTLLGPLAVSLGNVLLRRRAPVHPLSLTTMMYLQGAIVLGIATMVLEPPPKLDLGRNAVWCLAGLATVGTVLPTLLNYILIGAAGATNASLVFFLLPVAAVLMGATFLGEAITAPSLIGMGLIVAGSYLVVTARSQSWKSQLPNRP